MPRGVPIRRGDIPQIPFDAEDRVAEFESVPNGAGAVAGRRRQRLQGLNKIPSCMRPTADQRGIRDLAIADITVTLQVTPKARQKLSRIGPLPSRLIL